MASRILPLILREHMMDPFRVTRAFNQHIRDVFESDFMRPTSIFYRPQFESQQEAQSSVTCDKDKFQVNLDVQNFKPEEITVKMTGNKEITIEGKHEEKQDEQGFVSRHFIRRFMVPESYDTDKIVSNLSSDGVLTVTAPNAGFQDREIKINHTGKPAIENKEEGDKK